MRDLKPFPGHATVRASHWTLKPRLKVLTWGLGLLSVVWAQPAVQAQVCPPLTGAFTSPSLRVMTYNAAFQVAPGDSEDQYQSDFKIRAEKIAARILADNPDVVALQEINADGVKKHLIELLQGTYPSFVEKLDEKDLDNDSGLMLFSKFRFGEPAGVLVNPHTVIESENQGFSATVNGLIFSDTMGTDWWANKGAGMVRILNECNGMSPFHVAFTHMQADHDDDPDYWLAWKMEKRQLQLEQIKDLIHTHVGINMMPFEPVIVVGDLNIDGNLFTDSPELFMTADEFMNVTTNPHSEWAHTFDAADPAHDINNSFYACRGMECTFPGTGAPPTGTYLTDGWAFGTSPDDAGQTSTQIFESSRADGTRKDYVLHNRPKRRSGTGAMPTDDLCLQHITRGFAPLTGEGIGGDLSDHIAVTADFNRPAPRCSPHPRKVNRPNPMMGPEEVGFDTDPTAIDKDFSGTITFPGSVQWYVIDHPASYEIEIQGDNIGYRVYEAENLSNPMPPFNGECTSVPPGRTAGSFDCKFNMQEPPYFVQVFASATSANPAAVPDRTRAGDNYDIKFHRFNCSSIEEACLLKPTIELEPQQWPVGPLDPSLDHPDSNTMYFRFDTEFASDGGSPLITFLLEHDFALPGPGQPDVFSMQLVDGDNKLVCESSVCLAGTGLASFSPQSGWGDIDNDQLPDRLATAPLGMLDGEDNWTQDYYLKVIRDEAYQAEGNEITVTYETDLTYFRPLKLVCREERTDLGDDDIEARFVYDSLNAVIADLGWWWSDGHKIEQAGTTGAWLTEFPFDMDRSFLNRILPRMFEDVSDGDDFPFDSPVSGSKILPLDRKVESDKPKYIYSDEPNREDAEYWYEMGFQLTHERPACRISVVPPTSDCIPPLMCINGACQIPTP